MVLDTESKYWNKLTIEYMSEELDCSEDENSMIMHVLPWRSQGQYYWLIKNVSILLMKNFQCNKYY